MTAFKIKWRALIVCALILLAAGSTAADTYAEGFARCEIPVTCRISADIPVDMDLDFTYSLEAEDSSCPMPAGSKDGQKTVHMTDSGAVDFGEIIFDEPDVFRYTLKETTDETGRFRRDPTEYHTTLVAESDGNVKIVVNTDKGKKPEKIEFVNSYAPETEGEDDTGEESAEESVPKTGDSSNICIYMAVLAGCAFAVLILVRCRGQFGKEHARAAIAALMIAAVVASPVESAYARTDPVPTVSDYSRLPINNVELRPLNFKDAEFTSINSNFKKFKMDYNISGETKRRDTFGWVSNTAPAYGSTTSNTDMGKTRITGNLFSLRFRNSAVMSDGSVKDVLLTFSYLTMCLTKNTNNTTGSTYYYPMVCVAEDNSGTMANAGIGTGPEISKRIKNMRSGGSFKVSIRILEPGTNNTVPDTNYILGFRDLDVKDRTSTSTNNDVLYSSPFSEGIGLYSGYNEPVYLSKNTHLVQDNIGGIPKFRGTQEETSDKIEGGFDVSVKSSGFEYYWYGSHFESTTGDKQGVPTGTKFGYSPKVSVFAKAYEGGTIEKSGARNYLVNTSTSYSYTPNPGSRVSRLTVDGKDVEFDKPGGTYTFNKLTAANSGDYDHKIEVRFSQPKDIVIKKNVTGSLGDRKKKFVFIVYLERLLSDTEYEIGSDSTGQFTDVYNKGTMISTKKFRSDSNGEANLKLIICDDQFIRLDDLPAGTRYKVREEKSDHKPSFKLTGDGRDPRIGRESGSGTVNTLLETEYETINDEDGTMTVTFTNEKWLAPPTGVRNSRPPYVYAALIAVLIAAVLISVAVWHAGCGLRKRMQ